MKKSFIIAAFFLGACLTQFASAQESESTRETRAKSLPSIPLIIRGGLNFSDLSISESGEEELSRRTSFNVGVLFDFPLGLRFSLQSGLLLTSKGFKEDGYDNSQPATLTCNATYLEVPLLFVCHLPLGDNAEWLVNLGPYFAYGIDGKITYEATAWGQKYSSKQSIKTFGNDVNGFNLFNRFDCGI
nr:PorT family protein [Bacteroidaceae bacterium]